MKWPFQLLARDAFVKTNHRVVDTMFVRLSGMGVHCDHVVHDKSDLSLWLDIEPRWGIGVQTRRDISITVEDRG